MSRLAEISPHVVGVAKQYVNANAFSNPQDLANVHDRLNALVDDLVLSSTPGYPYCLAYSTNRDLLAAEGGRELIVGLAMQRVVKLITTDVVGLSAVELVQQGFVDPIRLMIKNEPHPIEKIAQGRYRLISVVSVVDQLVCRYFHSEQNQAEIDAARNGERIPNKVGLSVSQLPDCLRLFKHLDDFRNVVDNDMSGWDWSINWDDLRAAFMVETLCSPLCPPWFHFGRFGQMYAQSNSIFVLSDGRAWATIYPALQRSGAYTTASRNGRARTLLARAVGSQDNMSMGDDNVEDSELSEEDLTKAYRYFGKRLTDYASRPPGQFSFCSHLVTRADDGQVSAEPQQVGRWIVRAVASKMSDVDVANDLLRDLHWVPDAVQITRDVLWVRTGQNY